MLQGCKRLLVYLKSPPVQDFKPIQSWQRTSHAYWSIDNLQSTLSVEAPLLSFCHDFLAKIFVHKNCVTSGRDWTDGDTTVPGGEFRDTEWGPDHCEEWEHFCRTSFCKASFPLQILCICREANKAGKVNPSKVSYFSQGLENKGGGKKVGEHFVLSIFKTLGSTYKLWQQWDIEVPRWKNYSQGTFWS